MRSISPQISPDERNSARLLGFGRLCMVVLFALLVGRLAWRAAQMVRAPEPAAAAGGGAAPLSAVDARGKRVTLPAPPRRIVSLSPGTTEMLFALGLNGRIVADTTYCDYPPAALTLPKIGDVNTSTEKVIARHPDLVVADATANHRAIEPLERLGLRVFAIAQNNLADTLADLRTLGRITGQNAQAERLTRGLEARIAAVQRAVATDPRRPRVLDVVQTEPLMVVGSDNFMDDLITRAGGVNVGRKAGPGWNSYSPERAVVDRPDVILTGPRSIALVKGRAGWSVLPAVRNNAVYSLHAQTVRPGPRLVDALEELARLLHPAASRRAR